jgi:hypothetical protein
VAYKTNKAVSKAFDRPADEPTESALSTELKLKWKVMGRPGRWRRPGRPPARYGCAAAAAALTRSRLLPAALERCTRAAGSPHP